MRIVVTHKMYFLEKQIQELRQNGNVVFYDQPAKNIEEWVNRCKDADVICGEKKYVTNETLQRLKNVLIVIPYKSHFDIDKELCRRNNIEIITFSREYVEAVTEWIIGMIFYYYRDLHNLIRIKSEKETTVLKLRKSLVNKNITILGNGNIGKRLGEVCKNLGMNVIIYKRNNDLINKVKNADIIANCLRKNSETENILNDNFFSNLKQGSFFISVTPVNLYDYAAMIRALDNGILAAVAEDASSRDVGNLGNEVYQKLLKHQNILVTPHIAWMTDYEAEKTYDRMIDIIKNWKNEQ